mgnify:CR=1 FL=1
MTALQDDDARAWKDFLRYKEDKYDLQYRKKKEREQKYYKKYNRRRYWLNKYKESQGCYICGYKDNSYALSFENLDRKVQSNYIKWVPKKLIEYIRSKKIICQNCTNIKFKQKFYSTNPER